MNFTPIEEINEINRLEKLNRTTVIGGIWFFAWRLSVAALAFYAVVGGAMALTYWIIQMIKAA